ncbi:unnamed protein product [Eruca vesicaria subsp. sativa]|uniref:Uncharacterized protein n=1 Tax=Eruca vesicaria subsp. sativa TaxID=29727 RepID=A0ABC8JB25_ERUVS|nr:unnamed protein product [Eruca vesicaria subsp. sativa]
MDFHSLLRRDLQFLCKRNKIPANMTNLAMADALKSLEIVEGLDEYMSQADSNVLQSPTSVAKLPPSTAARTTRRKTAMKAETQSRLVSKSLDGEMDQENAVQEQKINSVNVAKTPAARSTRKGVVAASGSSKVQESKKSELVQSVYSTRRSTRLLEKCMADLSLVTKETEQKVSVQEKKLDGSEERSEGAEVAPGRDLSASMEKEWEMLENDSDYVTGGLEISVENTETLEVMSAEKEPENGLVQGDKQEETLQANEAICEEGLKKNDNDQEIIDLENSVDLESENSLVQGDKQEETLQANETIGEEGSEKKENDQKIIDLENCVDLDEILVLEHANTETNNENKELMNGIQAVESLGEVGNLETEQAIQENDSEPEKISTFHEETVVDQPDGDSETEPQEDDSGVDSDSTISEADSNQSNHQETEQAIQEIDSETVKINTFDEATMVYQTEPEEDDSGADSDGTISEADSNQAVHGSDIAEEEMILSESEGSVTAPTPPSLLLEEAEVKTAPLSPFAAESISSQYPRPNKSAATTPSKNSAMKLVSVDNNNNKENNMEMMVTVVNNSDNSEIKAEDKKPKKKVEFDEENLKDISIRQLVKLVKELSIKGSNSRTALQVLPGNNQIAE